MEHDFWRPDAICKAMFHSSTCSTIFYTIYKKKKCMQHENAHKKFFLKEPIFLWYLWYCGTYINKWLYNNVFYVPQMFHSCSTISFRSEIVEHFFLNGVLTRSLIFTPKSPSSRVFQSFWGWGARGKGELQAEIFLLPKNYQSLFVAVKNIAFNSETTGAYFAEPLFDSRQWCPSPFFDCISGREKTVGN